MKKILLLFVLLSTVSMAQLVRVPMLSDSLRAVEAQLRGDVSDSLSRIDDSLGVKLAKADSTLYATQTDISDMANKSDSTIFATQTDISDMMNKSDSSLFATQTDLSEKQDSIDGKLYSSFNTEYPNVADPSTDNYVPVMTGTGIRYSDLNSLPISSDVQTALNAKMNAADFSDSLATHIEGDTTIGTAGTLDSLITDYWNDELVNKQDTLAYHWGVMDTVTSGGLIGYKVESNITVVKVSAYAVTDSVWFNIQERGAATPNTAGDSLFASGMWASLTGKDSTSFSGSSGANIAKDNWIIPFINAYTTDAERFGITVWYIKQDY